MCPYVVVRGWPFLQSAHSVVRWGGEGAFSGQKRRRGSGIAGFPFVQAIDWSCSPFVWGFFRKRERFALPEWNLFCGFSVIVAGDQAI